MTTVQAARQLHLRTEFIDAIESERWERLGPPIYARGFIRNYAKLVGLDPASITTDLDEAVPAQTPDLNIAHEPDAPAVSAVIEPEPLTFRAHRMNGSRPSWYSWVLGAAFALATVLVFTAVYVAFAPAPRGQAQPQAQDAAQTSAQDSSPSPAPQDDAIFNGGSAGVAPVKGGVNLQLQLTQDSWLSVTVDGKRVVYETLPAGTVRDFHGVREITLRAGNAGGVNATIDGKPLGTLGGHGQVEERVFAAKDQSLTTGPRE
ncbi:MAG: helix-turn-helix domain-containing protein [Candidatus Eremiobacteraeota bacterium]|nr:helix-turn-helix domain-containing protein [Candidatus Eremiobacteraeota bacterium]